MATADPFRPGAYRRRVVDAELDAVLGELPAVVLDGPKGVGKTATALQRARTVRRLDDRAQRALLEADPEVIAGDPGPVLIDEWQRFEDVWDAVRRLVDADRSCGPFLLTGSALRAGTHSGAGRMVTLRMRPLCFEERGVEQPTVSFGALAAGDAPTITGSTDVRLGRYVDEILAGGFPGLRGLGGRALALQLDGYLERIVDHDLAEAGFRVRRPATVAAWLRAYAAATATTASWESIRDAATSGVANKPARSTTTPYVELLRSLRVLDEIPAWTPSNNHLGRLAAAPKHHLADPALAARLLGQGRRHLLAGEPGAVPVPRDGHLLGNLFESLVALSVQTYAQTVGGRVAHLRTESGRHEVDFIVESEGGVLAIEAKLSASVGDGDVRHLHWLRDQLPGRVADLVVVTTGPAAYRRSDGVAVVPLALLGA